MTVENSLTIKKLNKRIDELEACVSIMSDNLTDMWEYVSLKLDGPSEIEGDTDEYLLELLENSANESPLIESFQQPQTKPRYKSYNKQYYKDHKEKIACEPELRFKNNIFKLELVKDK